MAGNRQHRIKWVMNWVIYGLACISHVIAPPAQSHRGVVRYALAVARRLTGEDCSPAQSVGC